MIHRLMTNQKKDPSPDSSSSDELALESLQQFCELALPNRSVGEYDCLDPFISRLGGRPTWLTCPVPENELMCPLCKSPLYLLVQFNCPLSEPFAYDRVLYLLACNSKACILESHSSSFKAIIQCKAATPAPPKPTANFWEEPKPEASAFSSKDGGKRLEEKLVKCQDPVTGAFPVVVLKTIEELIRPSRKPAPPVEAESMVIEPNGVDDGFESDSSEEPTTEQVEDEHFEAFQERISHYPKQCFRHCPGDQPLFFSAPDVAFSAAPFECSRCRKAMLFLGQLMPAAISFLPVDDSAYTSHISPSTKGKYAPFGDGLEFGTVLVYSCPDPLCSEAVARAQLEQ